MQVKKNTVTYIILCNIPSNVYDMQKYVKICRITFNCSNANAAICGDYYILSTYEERNDKCTYIKILTLVIRKEQMGVSECVCVCVCVCMRERERERESKW
jgi:hypothetical protein